MALRVHRSTTSSGRSPYPGSTVALAHASDETPEQTMSYNFVVVGVGLPQIVSDNAVFARDFLAGAYMASKDKAGEVAGATVHKTLQACATATVPAIVVVVMGKTHFRSRQFVYRGVSESDNYRPLPSLCATHACTMHPPPSPMSYSSDVCRCTSLRATSPRR